MESAPGRQVLRIQLQALGPLANWFRPREAVLQRLLKKDEDGVYVVLFSSIETADSHTQEFGKCMLSCSIYRCHALPLFDGAANNLCI